MSSPDIHVSSRRRPALLLGLALAVMFMAACGKKGPLYLPEDAAPPAGTAAPAKK